MLLARHEAREFQRREQQGLGRPLISTQVAGQRVVAVGQTIHSSANWSTFHDFLRDYPVIALGRDWWAAEMQKQPGEQHKIIEWFIRCREQASTLANSSASEKLRGLPATGAVACYMHFAYDLYSLQHANEVETLLIDRIKSPAGFAGALHEVRVAASLLRAGFCLEMEDETDRRSTHVEFVATHLASGTKYSVEAKRREGVRLKFNKLLNRALSKHAEHQRIVFIDLNDERTELNKFDEQMPVPLAEAKQKLQLYERDPEGKSLPSGYVIATFFPEEHHLDMLGVPYGLLLWGFHVEDMKPGFKTLLQEVQTRRRHAPIFALVQSMHDHRNIPVTFDGEAAAYIGGVPLKRLELGKRYEVPGPEGSPMAATLESGVVMHEQKMAWCTFLANDGRRYIIKIPLTDEELRAYAEHPSTFFGAVDRNAGRKPLKNALDCFDFLWESYQSTPREKLLEFLAKAPDLARLSGLPQKDLATHYCILMANQMIGESLGWQGGP